MNEATPTPVVLDLGDVILRVRGIEIVDDNGDVRILGKVTTDGPCGVMAVHPFNVDQIIELGAGYDVEDEDGQSPGANLYLTDGAGWSTEIGPDGISTETRGFRVA
jgi:hypothetical protein